MFIQKEEQIDAKGWRSIEALERINDNAYKFDFPGDYGASAPFDVTDLSPYEADDYLVDLRIKSVQKGEDDGVPSGHDIKEAPTSLARSNASSKVQAMTHILQKSQEGDSGL